MNGVPQSDWNTPENMGKWQTMYQEMTASNAYKKLREEYDHLQQDVQAFVDKGQPQRGDPAVPHGYVWLFRRK